MPSSVSLPDTCSGKLYEVDTVELQTELYFISLSACLRFHPEYAMCTETHTRTGRSRGQRSPTRCQSVSGRGEAARGAPASPPDPGIHRWQTVPAGLEGCAAVSPQTAYSPPSRVGSRGQGGRSRRQRSPARSAGATGQRQPRPGTPPGQHPSLSALRARRAPSPRGGGRRSCNKLPVPGG